MIWNEVFKQKNTYDYYAIDYNRREKRFEEQNKSNIKLELKLKAIKVQSENVFNYLKKKNYKVKWLKIVIDQ